MNLFDLTPSARCISWILHSTLYFLLVADDVNFNDLCPDTTKTRSKSIPHDLRMLWKKPLILLVLLPISLHVVRLRCMLCVMYLYSHHAHASYTGTLQFVVPIWGVAMRSAQHVKSDFCSKCNRHVVCFMGSVTYVTHFML